MGFKYEIKRWDGRRGWVQCGGSNYFLCAIWQFAKAKYRNSYVAFEWL